MKQPELGRKIIELRKEKGLTQEEVVDKCNISVRTLQRIEAGEVTPRDFTIKAILAALDYDLSIIARNDSGMPQRVSEFFKEMFFIDIDTERPADYLINQLNVAWIFGLLYFVLGFAEAAADYFFYYQQEMIFNSTLYVILKVLILISLFFFQRGFILVGYLYQNYLLKIISYIIMFAVTLSVGHDLVSVLYKPLAVEFILGAESLMFGGILIIFGVSLLRLRKPVGEVAFFAGVFEILAGACFALIITAIVGGILLIPAELFEIVVLYKVAEILKEHKPVLL